MLAKIESRPIHENRKSGRPSEENSKNEHGLNPRNVERRVNYLSGTTEPGDTCLHLIRHGRGRLRRGRSRVHIRQQLREASIVKWLVDKRTRANGRSVVRVEILGRDFSERIPGARPPTDARRRKRGRS